MARWRSKRSVCILQQGGHAEESYRLSSSRLEVGTLKRGGLPQPLHLRGVRGWGWGWGWGLGLGAGVRAARGRGWRVVGGWRVAGGGWRVVRVVGEAQVARA